MNLQNEINETIEYLNSDKAVASIANDPYWPKWNTPWWRIITLFEMNLVHLVPEEIIYLMARKINSHFMKTFPLYEDEIPEGIDPYRHIPCHCALGSMYQALSEYGFNIDKELSWIRPWFLKYQLPDGGLNCDEQAYTNSKKSSIISSLPALEAILNYSSNGLSELEKIFVDKGAHYLINHRLVYKSNKNELIHDSFLNISFPRFYTYDFLRGLSYLVKWKKMRKSNDADEVIIQGQKLLKEKLIDKKILNEKISYNEKETLTLNEVGVWSWTPSRSFPLLTIISEIGNASPRMKECFDEVMSVHISK